MAPVVTKVTLNSDGVRALLKDPRVTADLLRRGEAIAKAAGPGHVVTKDETPTRVGVDVATDTIPAMRAEARDRTLTRALDVGR